MSSKRRNDIYEKKETILEWIGENKSKAFICKQIKCKPITLDGFLKEWGIDYKGNQSHKGIKGVGYISAKEYLYKGSLINSSKLSKKLLSEGIKERKCETCGLTEWLGKEIPLELHHINGDHFDNRLENLKILCPNCHAQTDNYCKKETSLVGGIGETREP